MVKKKTNLGTALAGILILVVAVLLVIWVISIITG